MLGWVTIHPPFPRYVVLLGLKIMFGGNFIKFLPMSGFCSACATDSI